MSTRGSVKSSVKASPCKKSVIVVAVKNRLMSYHLEDLESHIFR